MGKVLAIFWPAKYKSCTFSTELEALEKALEVVKTEIIFSDCKGAIELIEKWLDKTEKEKMTNT